MIVSVVTPSYNQGCYLAETIESVLSQEGDFRLDYLVIDGGSTDDSLAVIRRYEELLKKGAWQVRCRGIRFRWVSEKDRGQSDAVAKGFALAEGEVLAWLNSDDTYLPGALAAAVTAFRADDSLALLYGDAQYCDAAGATIGRYPAGDFDLERLAHFNFFCQPATFFRREAFAAVGGMDRSLQFAMDYDLFIRIAQHHPCSYLPQFLARYRLHEESKTVRDDALLANCQETLATARKHFGWAPLNYVYGHCHAWCRARLPGPLARNRAALTAAALLGTVVRSLWLNRGVRRRDLRLLTPANIRKLFKTREELLLG